jgi:hypothetical protein
MCCHVVTNVSAPEEVMRLLAEEAGGDADDEQEAAEEPRAKKVKRLTDAAPRLVTSAPMGLHVNAQAKRMVRGLTSARRKHVPSVGLLDQ